MITETKKRDFLISIRNQMQILTNNYNDDFVDLAKELFEKVKLYDYKEKSK